MTAKKWGKGFVLGKSTHAEVNKSQERKKADRKKVARWRDMEERELLKELGVGYEKI